MQTQFDAVITGGTVFVNGKFEQADIGVRSGKISDIGAPNAFARRASPTSCVSAKGLLVLPGVIDSHVHFREPGKEDREDIESGTRGAALGGVTCIFDMPNTVPCVTTAKILEAKVDLARGRAWCDYGFYVGADGDNTDQLARLERMPGVCGVKVFLSSSTTDLMVTSNEELGRIIGARDGLVAFHAEDDDRIRERRAIVEKSRDVSLHGEWRDAQSCLIATARIIGFARAFKKRVHILHVSTKEEIQLIADNRDLVTCEVLPQHLTFSAPSCYQRLGAKAQQNPPIREIDHQDALWASLISGVVDVVASDHGPHSAADKASPYPNMSSGMPGTQTLLPVMLNHVHNGRLSLARLVELVCIRPAEIFGLRQKGAIRLGRDADFTLVDLKSERTITNDWIASKVGWTAYDGMRVTGWPVGTLVRGHMVARDGELCGSPIGKAVEFDLVAEESSAAM